MADNGKKLDIRFKYDVAKHPGGENVTLCFACGTCTAGCPVSAVDAEFSPRKIIRQVILGMKKDVLASPVIWRCIQCYSCTAKCPQNVKFRDVMRALREMAMEEGYFPKEIQEQIEKLGELSQTLRRDMVNALVSDPEKFKKMLNKAEDLKSA